MGLHSAGTSWDVPGIPGYSVLRDLWASTVLRLPGNSGILSIQGSMCLHSAGTSWDVPGYLVLRDLCASIVLGLPRMSRESRDT